MSLSRRGRRISAWTGTFALLISVAAFTGGPPSAARAAAAADEPSALWSPTKQKIASFKEGHRRLVNPSDYSGFTLNAKAMADRLASAPLENLRAPDRVEAVTIAVPGPTGELIDFAVVESPIMADALQAAHPDIRTYAGSSITEGYAASIRLDLTPSGFHASVRSGSTSWYVDPVYLDDTSLYASYFGASLPAEERLPDEVLDHDGEPLVEGVPHGDSGRVAVPRAGDGPDEEVLQRVYRLALVTDASYAEFFAPGLNISPLDLDESNKLVLAAKTTLMNRVNQIYNDDLAIRMEFVEDTDVLLNLNNPAREAAAGLAGVGETGCLPNALVQNQAAVDTLIGPLDYDIGHLALGVNGGGVAFLGVVGQQGQKAGGCTGLPSPVGDFMAIDYVAHEMGHQFAGPHTFNGTQGSCSGGNRTAGSSVEPGSGSSVMAYAGICAADNLQPHTDPYFSQRTRMEIGTYVTSEPDDPITDTRGGFEVVTTTNHHPVVRAPDDVTIPIRTPFTLEGSATDSDGDELIYLWEQNDIGASGGVQLTDNTKATGPLFRVFGTFADVSDTDTLLYNSPGQNLATTSPVRTFPDMAQIASGNTNAATGACPTPVLSDYSGAEGTSSLKNSSVLDCYSEFLPTADYVGSNANATPPRLNFRLTARDLNSEGGGAEYDDVTLTIDPAAGPFLVKSQATPTTYDAGSTQAVTWAVNETAGLAPDVKISLSTDGGSSFPVVLAASTPNDGNHEVTLPEVNTDRARIKIEAVDNYFFDINDADFALTGAAEPTPTPTPTPDPSPSPSPDPSPSPSPTPTPSPTVAPDTSISSGPTRGRFVVGRKASYVFDSSQSGSTFECTVDGSDIPCATKNLVLRKLKPGDHVFTVAARNGDGIVDATPAKARFSVVYNERVLTRSTRGWRTVKNRDAYKNTFVTTSRRGRVLSVDVEDVKRVALLLIKGKGLGRVAVSLDGERLKVLPTKAKRLKVSRLKLVSKFSRPTSGTLSIRSLDAKPVAIDGIGLFQP